MSNWKADMINIDELIFLSEEEIADRVSKCRFEMSKRDQSWRELWERELAYAQRELQVRHIRRKAHQEFLSREAEEERKLLREDNLLPEYKGNKIPRYVRDMFQWS